MIDAQIRSPQELHLYAQDLAGRRVDDDPRVRKLQFAKQTTWLVMLALAFLFYYLIDRLREALALLG